MSNFNYDLLQPIAISCFSVVTLSSYLLLNNFFATFFTAGKYFPIFCPSYISRPLANMFLYMFFATLVYTGYMHWFQCYAMPTVSFWNGFQLINECSLPLLQTFFICLLALLFVFFVLLNIAISSYSASLEHFRLMTLNW